MSLFDDGVVSEERLLSALERIAMSLEVIAGLGRPSVDLPEAPEGGSSGVSYLDDKDEYEKELLRDAYYQRTGIQLAPGEDPPKVPAAYFERTSQE